MNLAKKIVPGETIPFPCWLWDTFKGRNAWAHYVSIRPEHIIGLGFTHWHPDQPEAPTEPPSSSRPANEGGAQPSLNDKIWEAIYHNPDFDDVGARRCNIISAVATRIATEHFASHPQQP